MEKQIDVCSYDVLPDGSMKPSAVQKYCQQIGLDDLSAYGASYQEMRKKSMVFVLMRLSMDFIKPVCSGEKLLVRTNAYKTDGVMFYRDYEFYRDGEPVIAVDSRWVLINFETRALLRSSQYCYGMEESEPAVQLPMIPRRIQLNGEDLKVKRTVHLTQTDENRHLNNCVYADILLDEAPVDLDKQRIRTLSILFDHEAYWKDELELRYQKQDNGFLVAADDLTTGKPCFQASCVLEKRG